MPLAWYPSGGSTKSFGSNSFAKPKSNSLASPRTSNPMFSGLRSLNQEARAEGVRKSCHNNRGDPGCVDKPKPLTRLYMMLQFLVRDKLSGPVRHIMRKIPQRKIKKKLTCNCANISRREQRRREQSFGRFVGVPNRFGVVQTQIFLCNVCRPFSMLPWLD